MLPRWRAKAVSARCRVSNCVSNPGIRLSCATCWRSSSSTRLAIIQLARGGYNTYPGSGTAPESCVKVLEN